MVLPVTGLAIAIVTQDRALIRVRQSNRASSSRLVIMTRHSVHRDLLHDLVGVCRDEAEMLLWMNLIHTHQIELVAACLEDAPNLTIIDAATERMAASVLAELWPDRRDKDRTRYEYWYRQYVLQADSRAEAPPNKVARVEALRQKLESDSRVKRVTVERF